MQLNILRSFHNANITHVGIAHMKNVKFYN